MAMQTTVTATTSILIRQLKIADIAPIAAGDVHPLQLADMSEL